MKILVFLIVCCILFNITGCSLMKIASQPFKNTVSKVPEKIQKSERKIVCKGEIILDEQGKVVKCNKNYYSYEKIFNKQERKLNFREKVSQFILNAKGYLLWFVIIAVVLSLSGFGWIVGAFVSILRGTGKVARDLVRGISKGKRYVRNNGVKYADKEREAYQQGLQDFMNNIENSVSNKQVKKIVNQLRAEIDKEE